MNLLPLLLCGLNLHSGKSVKALLQAANTDQSGTHLISSQLAASDLLMLLLFFFLQLALITLLVKSRKYFVQNG